MGQEAERGACQQHSRGAPGRTQQQAFAEGLPHQLPRPGAQRRAHRDFLAAISGARQQQVRQVRARDQQHECHASNENHQHAPAGTYKVVAQGSYERTDLLVRIRMLASQAGANGLHLGVGLRQRHSGLQACDHHPVVPPARRHFSRLVGTPERRPDLAQPAAILPRRFGTGGQHTDDGVLFRAKRDGFADNARIRAEPAPPKTLADQRDFGRSRTVLVVAENAPKQGSRAQCPQQSGGHQASRYHFRRALPEQAIAAFFHRPHVVEGSAARSPIHVIRRRHRAVPQAEERRALPYQHEAVRVFVRQRPQQHGVDKAEDGGVGPNADPERQDGDRREAPRFSEIAQRVAQIVQDIHRHHFGHLNLQYRFHSATPDGKPFFEQNRCAPVFEFGTSCPFVGRARSRKRTGNGGKTGRKTGRTENGTA